MNKAGGGDGIPGELFQILKDNAVKVLHLICQQIWKTQQWPRTGKGQFSLQSQRKTMPKNAQALYNCTHSHTSKVMLKILQARLQQHMDHEFPGVQSGFRKGRGTINHITNIHWIMEKARELQKNIWFCFINYTKTFDCVTPKKLWEILKEIEIQTNHLHPEKSILRSRSNS